jgi:hypothetical protein
MTLFFTYYETYFLSVQVGVAALGMFVLLMVLSLLA